MILPITGVNNKKGYVFSLPFFCVLWSILHFLCNRHTYTIANSCFYSVVYVSLFGFY